MPTPSPGSGRMTRMRLQILLPAVLTLLAHRAFAVPSQDAVGPSVAPPSSTPLSSTSLDRDNLVLRASAVVRAAAAPIADRDGNGVLQIVGRDDGTPIVVDLAGTHLVGGTGPSEHFTGIGIVIRGRNVTLRNGRISGFKVGIDAAQCDGLVLEDLDTSDNHAQALRSRAWGEDPSDWLFPHANDDGQWAREHGAGISVRGARNVVIRRVTSHRTQNGILLDRVARSSIYDNDCSFLSGWGIAMWRASGSTICRNSLDFCIRGYSHGVYNRGQDSAGILMFEQCSNNIVALNSATHCGDGVFGFAGREALGESPKDGVGTEWHEGRGSNRNVFLANDLSFAAAHGLEITFSFGNVIARNRLESNAICGVWAGYSRDTAIVGNTFIGNGRTMPGSERGGVNMEHAQRTRIVRNTFEDEPVAVQFWTDADAGFAALPWARANGMGARQNWVEANAFESVDAPLELRGATDTVFAGNTLSGACGPNLVDTASGPVSGQPSTEEPTPTEAELDAILARLPGERRAVGLRDHLRGRDRIIMLDHGPYAWDRPVLVRRNWGMERATYLALSFEQPAQAILHTEMPLEVLQTPAGEIEIRGKDTGFIAPYRLVARDSSGREAAIDGLLAPASWSVSVFPMRAGADVADAPSREAFAAARTRDALERTLPELDLSRLAAEIDALAAAGTGIEAVGVSARVALVHPPGRYRVHIGGVGGARLSVDGKPAIERWERDATAPAGFDYAVDAPRPVTLEIDCLLAVPRARGAALRVWFERAGTRAQTAP